MPRSRITVALLAVLLAQGIWLAYPRLQAVVLRYEQNPGAQGYVVATRLGCFNCHGADGRGGLLNSGSRWETVPGFTGQTLMMFVKNDAELREYILDGAPARKHGDEAYAAEMAGQAIRMPAFRGMISQSELDALVAFLRSASGMLEPPGDAPSRGAALARRYGCFNCHGDMGIGGRPNPGSFKGYIPGFLGTDFSDLVRSDEELEAWITIGEIERLRANPIGRHYLEQQRIRMPAFKDFLSAQEISDLAAYIRWLNRGDWRTRDLAG